MWCFIVELSKHGPAVCVALACTHSLLFTEKGVLGTFLNPDFRGLLFCWKNHRTSPSLCIRTSNNGTYTVYRGLSGWVPPPNVFFESLEYKMKTWMLKFSEVLRGCIFSAHFLQRDLSNCACLQRLFAPVPSLPHSWCSFVMIAPVHIELLSCMLCLTGYGCFYFIFWAFNMLGMLNAHYWSLQVR